MDMSQYLEIFIDETKEHLQGLNESLLQLEKNPEDKPMLDEIFRVAHTLKGMSGTMGFNKMAKLTHDMENVLQAVRNGRIKITVELIDLLFRCLDALEGYTEEIINSGGEGEEDYGDIIKALNESVDKGTVKITAQDTKINREPQKVQDGEHVAVTENFKFDEYEKNAVKRAMEMGMNVFKITVMLSESCVLKSARAFIVFQTLERYSEIIKSDPGVEDIEDEKFDFEFTVVCVTKEEAKVFKKNINGIAEVNEVRVTSLRYEDLKDCPQLETDSTEEEVKTKENKESDCKNKDRDGQDKRKDTQTHRPKTGKTVRVDINRLDVLMNLVSELIIIKTRLEGLNIDTATQTYDEAIEYLEHITTSLHDAVMKVRMVPVEMVFNRFPRMIRDVSREMGKEIELVMSGEETELDRTVIDEIGDPLIHLLRNSADHGIESKQERLKLGKPAAGHIYLRAYHDGNNVVIEIEDDGGGIDLEKVKSKAISKGIVREDMAETLSQKDIIDLLFMASFSTSDKVTSLSGRGVGLDVVKTKIEQLGGLIEVETKKQKGSKFVVRLPLTLAIIQALLVVIGTEKYAIPLNTVKEIIKITPEQIKNVQKQDVVLLRDTIIPIVRLDRILEVERDNKEYKSLTVVIVNKGEKLSGFLVDSLIGQQEVVIKSLGKMLSGSKWIAGATILGDGNVAMILDVNSLSL
ncbi:MAG: chemotaxis protein CheA [Clostridium sp.]|nr:chemotaxis protein CheA [Clostridium sp.]